MYGRGGLYLACFWSRARVSRHKFLELVPRMKRGCQKRFRGFCPLRGGGGAPLSAKHMGREHASREKKLPMVNFLIFVQKNVSRIRFQEIKIRP